MKGFPDLWFPFHVRIVNEMANDFEGWRRTPSHPSKITAIYSSPNFVCERFLGVYPSRAVGLLHILLSNMEASIYLLNMNSPFAICVWLPSHWTGARLRSTLLWYQNCCFSNVYYFVIMLTRYWSLSHQGHLQPQSKAWQLRTRL